MIPPAHERLPARLLAVLEEVARCALLIDLCADHARLAIAAVERGAALGAVAIDLRRSPLAQARRRVRAAGLDGRVLLVRGDGLSMVRAARAADGPRALVIAGVGGDLAARLLADSDGAAGVMRIVVQPNRHAREVRAWARGAGHHLSSERVAAEGRVLHLILTFARAPGPDPAYGKAPLEAELLLGPLLLASEEVTARAFLRREHRRLRTLGPRRPDLESALALLEARFARR